MGWTQPETVYQIEYQEYPGLEVTTYGASIGELLQAGRMPLQGGSNLSEEDAKNAFGFFAEKIVTWNVEHPRRNIKDGVCKVCGLAPGQPLPSTVDGLLCLDFTVALKIMFGWMNHLMRVSAPKELSSSLGENEPEDLMQKLAQRASQTRLPEPN